MVRYSASNIFVLNIVFIATLTTVATGLSLQEFSLKFEQLMEQNNARFSLEIEQLKQNDIAIKKEFELKIQHLETMLKQQQKEYRTSHESTEKETSDSTKPQAKQRNAIFRTCRELRQADPSLNSGLYWIDPDGQGVGDDPIYVHCNMTTGTTAVLHDSEDPTDVGHCAEPGCYSRPIKYSASTRQIDALAELSSECHQSIRYDCNLAPFEISGDAQAWWNDRNGVAQYFWSGSNNSIHTCQCGIDHNCVEMYNNCNCDSAVPFPLNDSGIITDKIYLPITRLNFGRTQLEASSGVHTLGRFECSGQVSVTGMPKSCSDLWKIGHTLSGIYSIMGSDYVETVYCDFAMLPHEQGYQLSIGFSDVKSLPVYFFVQKNVSQKVTGRVSYEVTRLNVGEAMNASSGIFTVPRSGIYSFLLSAAGYFPTSTSQSLFTLTLFANNNPIGHCHTYTHDDSSRHSCTLHSTLYLNAGDQIWIGVDYITAGVYLYDDHYQYTQFSGHLLQEKVASSITV